MKFISTEEMELRAKLAELEPLGEKLRAEKAAVLLAERTEARAKFDGLEQERDAAIPKLQAALAKAEGHYQAAKAALDKATNDFRTAKFELATTGHTFEVKLDHYRGFLLSTPDPAIVEAQKFFNDKLNKLRGPNVITSIPRSAIKNIVAWTKKTEAETNRAAVLSALDYCKTAIQALEQMKLSPALDAAAIERLKAEIPAIDRFETIVGEANLPVALNGQMAVSENSNQKERRLRQLLAA